MNKYILSFITLLIAITTYAQNYQCVQPGAKRYFINDNYYLRGIRIDSVKTIGADTYLYPFKSPRGNYYTEKLKPKGSWLGEKITMKPDGTTLFDNYWGDTVVIKTQAQLSDKWVFYDDTSTVYYTATVTSIDTMTVLGSLDSVKTITLNAYNPLGIITTDPFNNIKLKLSKDNGIVDFLNIYLFPQNYPSDYLSIKGAHRKTPVLHLVQFKNSNSIELNDFNKNDFFETYGEDWDTYDAYFHTKIKIIVDKTIISSTQIDYTIYTCDQVVEPSPLSKYTKTNTGKLSIYYYNLIDTILMPEEWGQTKFYNYNPLDTSFCFTSASYTMFDNFIYPDGSVNTFEPCGMGQQFKVGFGRIRYSRCTDPAGLGEYENLIYSKKNGTPCGNYEPLGIEQTEQNISVNIYPNPANDILTIETKEKDLTISLANTLGQIVMQVHINSEKTVLPVAEIPNGLYILRISNGEQRNFSQKVIVNH